MPEDAQPHASTTGITYAYAGGVAAAVKRTLEKLNPHREIKLQTRKADGIPGCKAMINDILEGRREGNFFEGMGLYRGVCRRTASYYSEGRGEEMRADLCGLFGL